MRTKSSSSSLVGQTLAVLYSRRSLAGASRRQHKDRVRVPPSSTAMPMSVCSPLNTRRRSCTLDGPQCGSSPRHCCAAAAAVEHNALLARAPNEMFAQTRAPNVTQCVAAIIRHPLSTAWRMCMAVCGGFARSLRRCRDSNTHTHSRNSLRLMYVSYVRVCVTGPVWGSHAHASSFAHGGVVWFVCSHHNVIVDYDARRPTPANERTNRRRLPRRWRRRDEIHINHWRCGVAATHIIVGVGGASGVRIMRACCRYIEPDKVLRRRARREFVASSSTSGLVAGAREFL